MDKTIFFIFLNILTAMIYSEYSAPILLFPEVAETRSLTSVEISVIFSAFPVGAFPISIYIGKKMRFYKKQNLLLIFFSLSCLSRFFLGIVYYIENSATFFAVSFLARLLSGMAEGAALPVLFSFIPDLYPKDVAIKFGILELGGLIGNCLGGPLAALIFSFSDYFSVFSYMSVFNLIIGNSIIYFCLKGDEFVGVYDESEKKSLPMKNALLSNPNVLWNTIYLGLTSLPYYMVQSSFDLYIKTLTPEKSIQSLVYAMIVLGMGVGVFVLMKFNFSYYERQILFYGGIAEIIFTTFFGPDTLYGIEDSTTKMILIGIAFFVVGFSLDVIFINLTKILIDDLLEVFPEETELCSDFANGLYFTGFNLDEFIGPIFGGVINFYLGYERIGTIFSLILLVFFVNYWIFKKPSAGGNGMQENKRLSQN